MIEPTGRQVAAGCRHYNGAFYHDRCEADIEYQKLDRPLPCLPAVDGTYKTNCPLFEYHTQAELDAKDKWFREELEKFERDLASDVCPHCGTKIESKKQVGRCVYAEPCGCRLYQGRLKREAK